jgi:hypothetical protein
MRRVTIDFEEEGGHERWCPFEYEFLSEFCHCCGVIGHTDKNSSSPVPVLEHQFGKWLRLIPSKRRNFEETKGRSFQAMSRSSGDWRKDKEAKLREKDRPLWKGCRGRKKWPSLG